MEVMIKSRLVFGLLVVFVLLSPAEMLAQLTRGFISGTVTDQSNAVIPGASIVIVNKATNIQHETLTNEAGLYRFVAVEPGTYSVQFSMSGFETRKADDIIVRAAQEVVINQTLAVGGGAAVVEVNVTPPGVELAKTTPTIDRTLSQRLVEEMPITGNTRDVTRLALLAPTVNRAPGSNEFSANGQRARNNNFLIDGTDNNDLSVTLSNSRIIPEAVGEFQVQTTAYSSEFGRNSGAQVSIITRSGTNALHGEVWDYYRGNWVEPLSLLNRRAGLKETPRFVQNQVGGDMAGPVLKDRTFFFGLLEANRRREAPDARNAASANVPTPAGFAALSSVPLGPDQTPASRQAVLSAMSFLPEVQQSVTRYDNIRPVTVNGVPLEFGSIRIPLANPHDFWYGLYRVDHKLTASDNLNYRYQFDKRDQPDVVSNLQFGNRWSGAQTILGQNHALSYTRNFTPRLINEFRFAYIRRDLDFPENDPDSPTVGITGAFTIGGASNFPQGRISDVFQFQDVATYLVGRHSLKIGADIRYNKLFNRAAFDSKGTWTFGSFADFMNNRATRLDQAVNEASFDARQGNQFYFFQDDIKVSKDLTVNLGLRYEYSSVPFGFFGAATPEIAAVGVPLPTRPDKNNWAPRFGFAYSPSSSSGSDGETFRPGRDGLSRRLWSRL